VWAQPEEAGVTVGLAVMGAAKVVGETAESEAARAVAVLEGAANAAVMVESGAAQAEEGTAELHR
jgi:hypothetical protein